MKTISRIYCLCICMALVSCDANKSKVADAAQEFLQALANNDKVTMYELYPDARTYTNLLPIKEVAEVDIKVEADNDGIYVANLDAKRKLVVKLSEEGAATITDSYNVLQLDSASYELAAKTGTPVNQLSDITKGQLFRDDSEYITYLGRCCPESANGNLHSHDGMYSWRNYSTVQIDQPITNNGRSMVKGDEYSVEFIFGVTDTGERKGTSVQKGVDLAPDETHVFTIWKDELYYYASQRNLTWVVQFHFKNMSQAAMLSRYGSFSGNEYNGFKEWTSSGEEEQSYNNSLSDKKLTEADLEGVSKKDLEIMRNMIYAKYGYKFKRNDLTDYFSKYSWYTPANSDAAAVYKNMSDIEKYNIEFIKKHE